MTAAYLGSWFLQRWIIDRAEASTIRCAGSAQLYPSGTAIVYDESVSFELGGKAMRATRRYRLFGSDNTVVATFDDASPFFELRLDGAGVGRALHRCGEDDYFLTLLLREPAAWQTIWDITGSKQLRIITQYRRSEIARD